MYTKNICTKWLLKYNVHTLLHVPNIVCVQCISTIMVTEVQCTYTFFVSLWHWNFLLVAKVSIVCCNHGSLIVVVLIISLVFISLARVCVVAMVTVMQNYINTTANSSINEILLDYSHHGIWSKLRHLVETSPLVEDKFHFVINRGKPLPLTFT